MVDRIINLAAQRLIRVTTSSQTIYGQTLIPRRDMDNLSGATFGRLLLLRRLKAQTMVPCP
jgi:hypothetical protein